MKKIKPIKTIRYDWLIIIPEPIRKTASGFKDKIVSQFYDKHTWKNCVLERRESF